MTHRDHLVDGRPLGGGEATLNSPFDGASVGTVATGGWAEMDAALGSAQRAFRAWQSSPRRDRQQLLRRVASLVRERADELVGLLTLEVGKPVTWSWGEVKRMAVTFDLAADLLTAPCGQVLPTDYDERGSGYRCVVERFPVGPVLAITPYNWPYNLASHKIAPALAAGNTVVMKPSGRSPLTSLTLAHLIHEAGCPAGVMNAVNCPADAAERAARDPRIRHVSFTGSESVGWGLKSKVTDKPVTLELGGDATAIVTSSADLDWAVKRCVLGGYGYAGQVCISIQHVLVHEAVYDEVRDRLAEQTASCPSGDPRREDVVCGPLIDASAADKVEAWVSEALAAGARLLAGGTRSGNVVAPTLLENVPPAARLTTDEVFGPVLTLQRFSSLDEAVRTVNASRFGIHCGVFTRDIGEAEHCYRGLDVGGVIVDDYPTLRFDNMPYGGVKRSGFGREGVAVAYEELTTPKVMLTRLGV